MAWARNGTETLSSPATSITISSLTDNKFLMYLVNTFDDTNVAHNMSIRLNSDTGNNYAWRRSFNGGTDSTTTSTSNMQLTSWQNPEFGVGYIINISSEEKLHIGFGISQNTAGASTAPQRQENVGKHAQTSNPVSAITVYYPAASYNYGVNSNLTIIGTN